MKNKIYIALFLLSLCSCQKFLEEVPKDQQSLDQYFTQPSHAYNAVNMLYDSGAASLAGNAGTSYSGSKLMFGGYMSGLFDNEYKGQEIHAQYTQNLTINGDNLSEYLEGIYDVLYEGISRANTAIKYIPETPGLKESEVNNLMAQARFFRALDYYYLVRMFGGVPIITEPYENLENLYVSKSSIKEVYTLIIEDLNFAIEKGGFKNQAMPKNNYQISLGTARTFLAEAYLTMSGYPLQEDHYKEAAEIAEKVIREGGYSLIQHDTDKEGNVIESESAYNKMRTEEKTDEYMYVKEYFVGIAESAYPMWTYPVDISSSGLTAYTITVNTYRPIDAYLNFYDPDKDLRVQEKQFFHSSMVTKSKETEKDTTIYFATSPYLWHEDEAVFETALSGKDIILYRYADDLLIAAEALAESQGVTPEAIKYLAEVKSRAYWKEESSKIESELASLSTQAFIEEVWKERLREFPLEFKTWPDIQRTRKYPVSNENQKGVIRFENVVGHDNNWGHRFEQKHLLFPFPETEIQRNPSLEQNPGY